MDDDQGSQTPAVSQNDVAGQTVPVTPPPQSVQPAPVLPPVVTGDSAVVIPPPVSPVSPKLKEQGPATVKVPVGEVGKTMGGIDVAEADKVAKEEGDEYWENFAREIELEKKIEEVGGVEKIETGEVKVPKDVAAEMGIKPTVTAETPVAAATGFSVRGVSLSDDQMSAGIAKPTSSGLRWLVEWFIYQLQKAHYLVKQIKGRVFREKKQT